MTHLSPFYRKEDFPSTPSAVYSKRLLANAEGRFDQDIREDEDNQGEDPLLAAATSAHHVRHALLFLLYLSITSRTATGHIALHCTSSRLTLLFNYLFLFSSHLISSPLASVTCSSSSLHPPAPPLLSSPRTRLSPIHPRDTTWAERLAMSQGTYVLQNLCFPLLICSMCWHFSLLESPPFDCKFSTNFFKSYSSSLKPLISSHLTSSHLLLLFPSSHPHLLSAKPSQEGLALTATAGSSRTPPTRLSLTT